MRYATVTPSWRAPTLARVADFSNRARSLAQRIESNRSDPSLWEELDDLRTLWRSLPPADRAEAAGAARALAQAQTAVRPPVPFLDDDAAAQLALSGLDRIDIDAPSERRYDGPRDPDALLAH